MSNCCSHGTFLHFSLQSSHLNICYYHQDLHRRPFHPGSRQRLRHDRRALLLVGTSHLFRRPSIGATPEVRRPHIAPAHVSSMRIESVHVAKREQLNLAGRIANSIRFPFNGFTYFLTLFSKSFSSFPHGTCSLSVSCLYLALDGVYHPFWAAFPNNPTLRKHIASARALPRTGLSPSVTCCSKQLRHARCAGKVLLETTIRRCNTTEIFKLS